MLELDSPEEEGLTGLWSSSVLKEER